MRDATPACVLAYAWLRPGEALALERRAYWEIPVNGPWCASEGSPAVLEKLVLMRCCYLPREAFFGRLGFAGDFFWVWTGDFGRFLPAISDSFPIGMLPGARY